MTGSALAPIHPSAAIAARYASDLEALVDEMHADVAKLILDEYGSRSSGLVIYASDDSPVRSIQSVIRRAGKRWLSRIDDAAPKLARHFATSVQDRCDRALMAMLRDAGMTVRLKMTAAMRQAAQATIAENVAEIRSIPEQYLGQVEVLVMQSVQRGRDLGGLSQDLTKRYGITKHRAAGIALRQNNLATTSMRLARELDLGLTEGEWLHSAGGREPRPPHVAYTGKRFDLRTGHDFHNGEGSVRPGEPYGCRCTWKTVIPGFDD